MGDYHNGLHWLWIGCIDAVAKFKANNHKQAKHLLFTIAKKIVEFEGVFEVYFEGKPVKRLFYSSEQHFAWSSGLFVWACHECRLISADSHSGLDIPLEALNTALDHEIEDVVSDGK